MSAVTSVLRVGLRINHDGGVFTVVELAGRRLLLRRHGDGELRQVEIGWLLSHPTTSVTHTDTTAAEPDAELAAGHCSPPAPASTGPVTPPSPPHTGGGQPADCSYTCSTGTSPPC